MQHSSGPRRQILLLVLMAASLLILAACVQTREVRRTPYGVGGQVKIVPSSNYVPPKSGGIDFLAPFKWIGKGIASLFSSPEPKPVNPRPYTVPGGVPAEYHRSGGTGEYKLSPGP